MAFSKRYNQSNWNLAKKMMISYSIILFIILFTGLYLYQLSRKNLENSIQKQNQILLSDCIKKIDSQIASMQSLALSLVRNSNISRLANINNTDANFYNLAYHTKNEMITYLPLEQLLPIDTYFIYFNQNGYTLTSSQFTSMDMYYRDKSMLEGRYGQWKDMLLNKEEYLKFLPLSDYKSESEDYLYILPLDHYVFQSIPAKLCFIIDYNKIKETFRDLDLHENDLLYVVDTGLKQQFTIGTSFKEFISSKDFIDLPYQNNIADYTINKKKMVITRQTSEITQWTYYLFQSESELMAFLRQYQMMFLIIIASGLLIGIILLYFLSLYNTRPFVLLNNQLNDSIIQTQELKIVLEKQRPVVRNSYIREIMLGKISSQDEMDYIKDYLEFNSEEVWYYVLYIASYPTEQQQTEDNTSLQEESFLAEEKKETTSTEKQILSSMQKYFGEPLYLFIPKEYNYAILLSAPKKDSLDYIYETLKIIFSEFHNEMLQQYSIWTMGGIGNLNHRLENTWKSYQQAMESVSYTTNTEFFCSYGKLELSSNVFYYPVQMAESLTNFIKAGNKEQVKEIFKFIHKENLEKRTLPFYKMKILLLDIYNTLVKIRFNIFDAENIELSASIDTQLNEHLSLKQLEDAALSLCECFVGKTSKKQTIIDIKNYIQENYYDSSLCLTKISDTFGLSESYFSYLFKEETGENFSIYLEQIRMKEALKLVNNKIIPLSELYEKVGYNNANTFRRVFKKTYGISAKGMRDRENTEIE